jgi:peptidoglycan hydrolase-like protein with peptidoglycan-binding domain
MTLTITASVGKDGANKRLDVAVVQNLLSTITEETGGAPGLVTDGWNGPNTVNAIKRFQQHHFGFADGLMSPGEISFRRLNDAFDRRWSVSNPEFPLYVKYTALVEAQVRQETGLIGSPPHLRCADNVGWKLQLSSSGNIYYHPAIGAYLVDGYIWAKYLENSEEHGVLGYPISDERDLPQGNGRISYFQYGSIQWTPAGGPAGQATILTVPGL